MSRPKSKALAKQPVALFDRIVTILEEARSRVVRAVNTGMVTAYWLIGREIVEAVQGGDERAEYGKQVIESLSAKFMEKAFPSRISGTFGNSILPMRTALQFSTRRAENLENHRAGKNSTCRVGNPHP